MTEKEEETKAATSKDDDMIRLVRMTIRLLSILTRIIEGKRRTRAVSKIALIRDWLWNLRAYIYIEDQTRSQMRVAGVVYNCSCDPVVAKLKGESLWDRMRKSLGKEHWPQIDELYTALKAYVEPVSLAFISAK